MPSLFGALFALILIALATVSAPDGARAQSLPIPGLPGGLGGIATPNADTEPQQPPSEPSGSGGGEQAPAANATEAQTPTQALIDILRDEAAREALIRELEAASGAGDGAVAGTDTGQGAPASGAPAATTADATTPPATPGETSSTVGQRAIDGIRAFGVTVLEELEASWLRLKRAPSTVGLSARVFEEGALMEELSRLAPLILCVYGAFFGLRMIVAPLRRRIGRAGTSARWLKTLLLRMASSALDVVSIPLAVILGLILLVATGYLAEDAAGDLAFSGFEPVFLNAFVAVEVARTVQRFFLSPRTPSLRVLPLPDRGADVLWYAGWAVIYVVGYGQLLIVPIVSDVVSIFVGRSVGAVMSAAVVFGLILLVLATRKSVGLWLSRPESESTLVELLRPLAMRWHWPLLAYLVYVFVIVLTRPGNVLLPLLQTSSEVLLVVIVGVIVLGALSQQNARRISVPAAISHRLPLFEERVNQLRPAFFGILRFLVLVVMVLVLLNVMGIQGIGGFLSSAVLTQLSSGLFGVLLIVSLLALVWLGMTSWVDFRLNPFVGTVPTSREITLLTLMKNAVTVAIIIIGIITSLAQLGMNVGPLIASAGVIGLAISFGAQRMVEDIFAGIFIQAENAMNVGDVVDVGGTVGTVEKLTVRSVTLRDLSGVVHVIPFSSASKISNYMRDFAYHVADIGVAYREDIEDVRVAMHEAFDRLRKDPDIGPQIIGELEWFGLNAFGASELMMRARIKTVPGQQWGVGRAYNAILKQIFDEHGIEIPFPHQTLYFGEDKHGNAPPLNLRVQRKRRDGEAPPPHELTAAPEEAHDPEHDGDAGRHSDRARGSDHPDEDGR